jgi:opacity protein-like surface antigen
VSDNDFGFYGGFAAGAIYSLSEKIFINAEYEIAWLASGYYKDGWLNTVNAGIGFKF